MKTTLKSTLVYVNDVTATSAFYQKALGLVETMATEDGRYVQLETGDVAFAFAAASAIEELGLPMGRSTSGALAPPVQFAFETEDVEAAVAQFVSAGGAVINPPVTRPWGQTLAHLRDINGFIVEIGSIQSGDWDEEN